MWGTPEARMKRYRVGSSARIAAPPDRVYATIADYRQHHPNIIPPKYFRRLEVLEGGIGAGTRTRVEMRIFGSSRVFEQVVTEPEAGRALMETNLDGSGVTTFTVKAADGGQSADVSITTEISARPGVRGLVERLFISLLFPKIYRNELAQLARYLAGQGAAAGGSSGQRAPG
jgi:hypothetical protein